MDVEKNKILLIAYAYGQLTAYGITVTEEDIHRLVIDHAQRENLPLEVTESDIKAVTDTLFTLRVLIKSSTPMPYQ